MLRFGFKRHLVDRIFTQPQVSPTASFVISGKCTLAMERVKPGMDSHRVAEHPTSYSSHKPCAALIQEIYVVVVQSLSHVQLFVTPGIAAHQASLSFTISRSLLKLMSIESVMPSNHLIFCCSFPLLPSIFPSIRVFSIESALHIRWPKYWSFSFSISPFKEYSGLLFLGLTGLISLLPRGLSRVFSNTTVQNVWPEPNYQEIIK